MYICYGVVENNCTTYAVSEWSRVGGEYLPHESFMVHPTKPIAGDIDSPPALSQSIIDRNKYDKQIIKDKKLEEKHNKRHGIGHETPFERRTRITENIF